MSRELQKLHYPTAYSFSRDDIGRIVLFKSEKDLALYPFMIIFNAHQTSDTDDDILLKDVLTEGYKREDVYTIGQIVGELGYDYVQIVKDNDDV